MTIRNNLFFTEEPSFHRGSVSQIVATWINLSLFTCAPFTDHQTCTSMDPIIEFKYLLCYIFTHNNSDSTRIILAGDFNLPDIATLGGRIRAY